MRTITLILLLFSSVSVKAKYCAFKLSSNQGGYSNIEYGDYPYDTSTVNTYNPTDSISFLLEQDMDCHGSMTNVNWYKDGILVYSQSSTSYSYTYKTAGFGTYTCKFDYSVSVYSLTIILQPINTSISDYAFSNNILVFPNPSIDGLFTIENLSNVEMLQIYISDISGRILEKIESNDTIFKIDLSESKKGFYTLICTDNKGRVSTKKIIYN
ncbi:MAG: hypothetical protein A3K10_07930 [Bacteroidetes bacterium RIFCSPLOWO2_12_FULL_31_6]|nr:MAG: hypothetical protein A3K10_07930 [Bacteroidetes bacterium RIFCSPLOWO2_12_FULL_31_6]